MYAALFEISGWLGTHKYIFEGNSANLVVASLEQVQDLSCLARIGAEYESVEGLLQVEKLNKFVVFVNKTIINYLN